MRKTKIVCTIGPACESEKTLKSMMLAGMNVARLNFSHGSHPEHKVRIDRIKKLRKELDLPVAILLDTRGPEIRTRKLDGDSAQLVEGNEFILTTEEIVGDDKRVAINYPHLPEKIGPGTVILIDDGLIELKVKRVEGTEILCDIVAGGLLKNSKSLNVPGTPLGMTYISESDKSDFLFGIEQDVDFFALSFVRTARDVKDVRQFLIAQKCYDIALIAKIENAEGVDNIDDIINVSNGIMVARGDMGVEIPLEELPHIQKKIIQDCYTAGKVVITATQMLESMVVNARPTRAEVTDVANAIYDGTSAIMLSGETAAGAHPLKALETMSRIAEKTESSIDYRAFAKKADGDGKAPSATITNAISDATCRAAQDLGAAAVVAVTMSGSSARMISKYRPTTPIIAITPKDKTYRQLALSWGVTSIQSDFIESATDLFDHVLARIEERGLVKSGDFVVITGSSKSSAGVTNTLQAHTIGNILLKGTGSGGEGVSGRICVIMDEKDLGNFTPGDILVVSRTTTDILHSMKQCSGIITEERTSESGIVPAAVALGIPVISDAKGAIMMKTGSKVRIDPDKGYVYNSDAGEG